MLNARFSLLPSLSSDGPRVRELSRLVALASKHLRRNSAERNARCPGTSASWTNDRQAKETETEKNTTRALGIQKKKTAPPRADFPSAPVHLEVILMLPTSSGTPEFLRRQCPSSTLAHSPTRSTLASLNLRGDAQLWRRLGVDSA